MDEKIDEYIIYITNLLKAARLNATQDDVLFYIMPKLISCISRQYQPILRVMPKMLIQTLIYTCQSY